MYSNTHILIKEVFIDKNTLLNTKYRNYFYRKTLQKYFYKKKIYTYIYIQSPHYRGKRKIAN